MGPSRGSCPVRGAFLSRERFGDGPGVLVKGLLPPVGERTRWSLRVLLVLGSRNFFNSVCTQSSFEPACSVEPSVGTQRCQAFRQLFCPGSG